MRNLGSQDSRMAAAVFPELVRREAKPAALPSADLEARAHGILERAEHQAQALMEAAREKAAGVTEAAHRE